MAAKRGDAEAPVERGAATVTVAIRWCAIFAIRFYQAYIRPHLIGRCRFTPTCSEYGIGCIHRHGLVRGGWYTFRRVMRCHPFSRGGVDPVPAARSPRAGAGAPEITGAAEEKHSPS
jgi:putative membrane protein insertion efficiency factor